MEQVQSVQMGQFAAMQLDSYQPALFKEPTVYILEERRIGQRSYPTRYVVIYQDMALKRPGYRLSWMTVPDNAVKTAQAVSLVSEKEEAARKKENEALKKRGEALEDLDEEKRRTGEKEFQEGTGGSREGIGVLAASFPMRGKRDRPNGKFKDAKTRNSEPRTAIFRASLTPRTYYFFCLARASASAMAIVPVGCGWRSGACWGSRRTPVTRIAGYS